MARTDLEQLVYQMSTDIRALERQNKRALTNVETTAGKIEGRYKQISKSDPGRFLNTTFDRSRLAVFEAGSARLPVFGSALEALGPAGLIAAGGLAATALAATQAIAAMQFADEIDDTAQKLAVGTEALQEYRFAMTEVGGETKDADAAIESFQRKLGEAQSGLSAKAIKPFAALGFTQEELKTYQSFEEILPEIANRVSALGKESERAAVVEKLGLGPMLPLLREGAVRMDELRQKARDLGYVMDAELVKKGADANQEFETMARIIDVQVKSAFVGLSDEVLTFTGTITGALNKLNDFLNRFGEIDGRMKAMYGFGFGDLAAAGFDPMAVGGLGVRAARAVLSGRAARVGEALNNPQIDVDDPALVRQSMAAAASQQQSAGGSDLADTSTAARRSPGGARSSGPSAEEIARRRNELEQTLAIEIARLANNEQLVRELERERSITQRTAQYEGLRMSAADARTKALEDQARLDQESADANERQRATLADQAVLEADRLLGNERNVDAAERAADYTQRLENYRRAGLGVETRLIQAGEQQSQILGEHVDMMGEVVVLDHAALAARQDQLKVDRARAQVTARIVADAAMDRQLLLAQIGGDERRVRVLKRAAEIARRAREFEKERKLNAGEGVADATKEVDEEIAAASRRGFRDGVRGMLDDLQDGGLEGVLTTVFDRVTDRMKDNIADILTDFIMQAASQSGPNGSGGWQGEVANAALSLFGRRASGGPVRAGTPYIVGEKRPEVFVPTTSGSIMPSVSALARQGGAAARSGPLTQMFVVHAQGAVLAAGLVAELKQHGVNVAMAAGAEAFSLASKTIPNQMRRDARYSFRGR